MSDLVLVDIAEGVFRLTLNRPEKLNAFTAPMHAALRDALDRLEADPAVRVLLIAGAGRSFCAGQDLAERITPEGSPPVDLGHTVGRDLNPLVSRIRALPFPVIAAVQGVAAGAGASLALSADLVLAARSASFVFSFTRVGLGPDGGASWVLPRLIGPARAAGLALLGDKLPAPDAEAWGLIWRCVDDEALESAATDTARRLASQPREALAQTKRALQQSWQNDLAAQLAHEQQAQRHLGFSADYKEGVTAFVEKRPPAFK